MGNLHKIEPEIGHWYDSKDAPEAFIVIDTETNELIQIQYQDGELDKIDYETWATLRPEEIAEPDNAAAAFELDKEDLLNLMNDMDNEADFDGLESHLRNLDDIDDWR